MNKDELTARVERLENLVERFVLADVAPFVDEAGGGWDAFLDEHPELRRLDVADPHSLVRRDVVCERPGSVGRADADDVAFALERELDASGRGSALATDVTTRMFGMDDWLRVAQVGLVANLLGRLAREGSIVKLTPTSPKRPCRWSLPGRPLTDDDLRGYSVVSS